MSVFTSLNRSEIQAFLYQFNLGTMVYYEGAPHGVENTNYFITTESEQPKAEKNYFVLTIFEQTDHAQIPFFVELLQALRDAQLPVPAALKNQSGEELFTLAGKPTVLVPRLKGAHILNPDAQHCRQVGQALARIHCVTQSTALSKPNPRNLDWMLQQQQQLRPFLNTANGELLSQELSLYQQEIPKLEIPRAVIHGDLFRDNALFDGDKLSGIIDFYNACTDFFIYDLAITANDWCLEEGGKLHRDKLQALVAGYHQIRPISDAEFAAWPILIRYAATRFWLSRSVSWFLQNPDQDFSNENEEMQLITMKNPQEFREILQQRINNPFDLESILTS